MEKFMLGKKAGMTQIFDEAGLVIPVTVIDCGPLVVVQNKTVENDGYKAVKVGYGDKKKVNKPDQGQFAKAESPIKRTLKEFKSEKDFELGQVITVAEMFETGDAIDVRGTSKGKGYQGPIKRHGYSRGPMSHGSKSKRVTGSFGSSATPARVRKGKKMAGQMGSVTVTVQNLKVVQVDGERNILVVRGSVPGPKGAVIEITGSVKA